MTSYWFKLDYETCEAHLPQFPSQGRSHCLLHMGKDRIEAHQVLSRHSVELRCGDGCISLIPSGSAQQTGWNGAAQYHCEDSPLQAKDFGEGVGHLISINQSTFGMDSSPRLHSMILIWIPPALPRGNALTFSEKCPSTASSNTRNRHSHWMSGGYFWQLPVLLNNSRRSRKRTSRLEQILFENRWVNHVPMHNEYVLNSLWSAISYLSY